jgi:hypothetical protein
MPRARKPRQSQDPEDSSASASENPPSSESADDSEAVENRPSQLDAIRAALATPPASALDEAPELPAPDEPAELPAPEEPPELEAHGEGHPPDTEPMDQAVPDTAVAAAPVPAAAWVPPPAGAPRPAAAAPAMRSSTSLALGIVLVVVGVFFLVMRVFNVDLSVYGWPLYVIIPGLTLLVVGFVSLGSGAIIPGGIVTLTGLVLAYQNATGDWASWAYAWALVMPGGVGLGILLGGLRERDARQIRQGWTLLFWALLIFIIGFVFFESILNVSGTDYGVVGRAALPALLIIIGVTLLVRSIRHQRAATPAATAGPPAS